MIDPSRAVDFPEKIGALTGSRALTALAGEVLSPLGAEHCSADRLIRSFFCSRYDIVSVEYARRYVRQGLLALRHAFVPWVLAELPRAGTRRADRRFKRGYVAALKRQHRIQVCGWDGARRAPRSAERYAGYANGWMTGGSRRWPSSAPAARPGRLRHRTLRVLTTYHRGPGAPFVHGKPMILASPVPPARIPAELDRTAAALWDALGGLERSRDRFEVLLAEYVHRFFWTHPFSAVNRTLCLAQLNVLLLLRKEDPIEQGWLDRLAFEDPARIDAAAFKTLLRDFALRERN